VNGTGLSSARSVNRCGSSCSTISSVVWSSRPSSERDSSIRPSRNLAFFTPACQAGRFETSVRYEKTSSGVRAISIVSSARTKPR